jgi:AcrR family transcriptional regulator
VTRAATQLPPGRHGLTREQVRESQRSRMLAAMAAAVAEHGYVGTSVADVIGRAGVSRETFYEHFADKEECFLEAFDQVVADLTRGILTAVERSASDGRLAGDPFARLEAALGAYLDMLARERPLARTFLIEVYGAGPAALRRRATVFESFVNLVAEAVGATSPDQRFACEAFVGAASSIVTMRIAAGDHDSLPALREPLMEAANRLLATA